MAKLAPRKDKIAESIRKVQLSYPYLGELHFTGADYRKVEYKVSGDDVSYNVLELYFELHGDTDRPGGRTQKGTEYTHQIYAFNHRTTKADAEEQIDHLYYICEYFFGETEADRLMDFDHDDTVSDEDAVLEAEFEVWVQKFINRITSLMSDDKTRDKIHSNVRKTKIAGYVSRKSNRKPRTYLRWTSKFAGWLARIDEPLQFEASELRNNTDYIAYIEGATATTNASGAVSSGSDSDNLSELEF